VIKQGDREDNYDVEEEHSLIDIRDKLG